MFPAFRNPRSRARAAIARAFSVAALLPGIGFLAFGAEDPFAANVRPTDPLAPTEQRAAFEVPEGFEVQLVAHEPDVHKPMNLAFDATGRLWVTTSREYPTPVPVGQAGRDRVMIFDDFAPDGRARKVTTFADGLNIPIGVYPFRTDTQGWKAIVWSIPHIWLLEDKDSDGKADSKKPLYGPFDHTRDTHGNQASFRRGFDGWLYATHGYNNDSHVRGGDGHQVDMNSGNTYRIRLDGSRIEPFTRGQVNPFGLAFDPSGNLYSSDCHSDPIYLLLPGGNYPSFGKPHDGLGFAPNMMEQIRGSTAIDGITYYADDLWPDEYKDCVFIGDVMTSRVYRDRAAERGSGRVTQARPDFIASRDPWFRPVDTTLGPDGAFYVADFYNRIIGHYEVPLSHPGRDRERGRIWRVIHRGKPLRSPALPSDLPALVAELGSPSLPRRMLASHEIADRFGTGAVEALRGTLARPRNAFQHVHALWLLHRAGQLTDADWNVAAKASDSLVRIHARRVAFDVLSIAALTSQAGSPRTQTALAISRQGLDDPDPAVQRAGIEALSRLPESSLLPRLLEFIPTIPANDVHLRYSARRTLRNLLDRDPAFFASIASGTQLREHEKRTILDVTLAVPSEAAARFLLKNRSVYASDAEYSQAALAHAARHASAPDIEQIVAATAADPTLDPEFKIGLFRSLQQGFARRGASLTPAVQNWGADLARFLLRSVATSSDWSNIPLEVARNTTNPWEFQERPCTDGTRSRLLSSHPRGEQLTGTLRSIPFNAPPRLAFFLAGHDGPPAEPAGKRNRVTLRDSQTQTVLAEAFPPRQDTAQRVDWDLSLHAGKKVVLEVTDGDPGPAFAWLAFGRLEPAVVSFPQVAPATVVSRQIAAAEIAGAVNPDDMRTELSSLAAESHAGPSARAAAFRTISDGPLDRAMADVVADESLPHSWRTRMADVLFREPRSGTEDLIAEIWKLAPQRFQIRFAGIGATSPRLASNLVARMAAGTAPAGLLQDRRLRERLLQASDPETRATIESITKDMPSEDESVLRILADRRTALRGGVSNPARGKEIFTSACAACHQIEGQGGLVGPQLTGIGTRGEERLLEDILIPNRNVDHAFWTTVLTLKDGETTSGLFRREEGEVLVFANAAGTEFSVRKSDIANRRESSLSLMPSNFGEAIAPEDFVHLMNYLLSQRGTP